MMAHESGHYSEFSTGVNAAMQGFENSHEFLGIQAATGMDILGLSSKQQSSQYLTGGFLHQEAATSTAASPWPAADDSLRSLFSCEEPNRNLSLSIFNMKHQPNLQQYVPRDMLQLKAANFQQQLFMQQHFQLRNSKFLRPARELLSELCSLVGESSSEKRPTKTSLQELQGKDSLSSSWNQSLYSMDILELRRIKAKLLCMLEEVDKRYRKYCGQMRSMAVSIEAVCGAEAARVYTELASKAMSRHFRCLRDGIVGQIRAVKKAMEEKDSVATGPTRGETPRLKLLEQCMRQQRAFQQGMMEQPPWRPQRGLPERSVSILRAWLFEHFLHPYPNDVDKHILARQTGLTRSQVSNWFINARVRLWKPMVEEMYLEEMKELDNNQSNSHHAALTSAGPEDSSSDNPNSNLSFDQKPPLPVQLLVDSGSLSYVINSNHIIHGDQSRRSVHNSVNGNFSSTVDVGDVEDYFSYRDCGSSSNSRRTGSVSLTLGLQQHNGGGMSLSLLPNSHQPSSLLFSRDNIHGEQQVHYSILDGEGENQLPYRDLMGAHHQLLHDLAR